MEWRDALGIVLEQARPLSPVRVPVSSLRAGTLLAESIFADLDSPPFAKALMDGYALAGQLPPGETGWPIEGSNLAGHSPLVKLPKGRACRIATGAPLPEGADRVIPREYTREDSGRVIVEKDSPVGSFLAQIGEDFRKGDCLLTPGTVLNPGAIATLAATGKTDCLIQPSPRLAVISTGSELVEAPAFPQGSQIRNSNGPMLTLAASHAGAEATYLGLASDDLSTLKERFSQGLEHSIVLITGGVSVGDKDLVRPTLESLGVRILVHGVRLKPGKPFLFGVGPNGSLVLGLPGNPTSALANFELYARPALLKLRGYAHPGPHLFEAQWQDQIIVDNNRPTMRPVAVSRWGETLQLKDLGAKGSFEAAVLSRCQAWMFLEPGRWELKPGQPVRALVPSLQESQSQFQQNSLMTPQS